MIVISFETGDDVRVDVEALTDGPLGAHRTDSNLIAVAGFHDHGDPSVD